MGTGPAAKASRDRMPPPKPPPARTLVDSREDISGPPAVKESVPFGGLIPV
jgi:hypothetical protein